MVSAKNLHSWLVSWSGIATKVLHPLLHYGLLYSVTALKRMPEGQEVTPTARKKMTPKLYLDSM